MPTAAPPAAIRVVPAPRTEPPHDDELASLGLVPPPMGAPLLPLELPGGGSLAAPPAATKAGTDPAGARATGGPEVEGGRPAITLPTPPPAPVTRRLVSVCLEIQGGFRPVVQLRPLCRPESYHEIARRLLDRPASQRGCAGPRRGMATGTPARRPGALGAAPRSNRNPVDRISVLRVRTCAVSDEVAEITAVLSRGGRVWAMALRMEAQQGRWLCTHLELI